MQVSKYLYKYSTVLLFKVKLYVIDGRLPVITEMTPPEHAGRNNSNSVNSNNN